MRFSSLVLLLVGIGGSPFVFADLPQPFVPLVYCNPYVCGDTNGSYYVDTADQEIMARYKGYSVPQGGYYCVDCWVTENGYCDTFDMAAFDWLCLPPATLCDSLMYNSSVADGPCAAAPASFTPSGGTGYGSRLLVAGHNLIDGCPGFDDELYVFDTQLSCVSSTFSPVSLLKNEKILCDPLGNVYQLNSEHGLIRLNDGTGVVTVGGVSVATEPRYSTSAVVYIGVHEEDDEYTGRPLTDAVVTADGYAYVVPVLVVPSGSNEEYLAAAKLQLHPNQTPCYSVVQLYDAAPDPNETYDPIRTGLREIEVDDAGNVYVLSARVDNNLLWAYPAVGGAPAVVDLDTISGVTGGIPNPIYMCVSRHSQLIYMASGVAEGPNMDHDTVYALSTASLSLTLSRTVDVNGMSHVSGITEDPATGEIWVVGTYIESVPEYVDLDEPACYAPCMAMIPPSSDDPVTASLLTGSDLGYPIDVTWMPANLISSNPVDQDTLWRYQKNVLRLYFDGDITAPSSGQILIQEMLPNGAYGSDISSGFTFTVENDPNGNPRILRINETNTQFTWQRWYAIRNVGDWKGVSNFTLQHATQVGDATNDGAISNDDKALVMASLPVVFGPDDLRTDINGDTHVISSDYSAANTFNPSNPIPKPSGH